MLSGFMSDKEEVSTLALVPLSPLLPPETGQSDSHSWGLKSVHRVFIRSQGAFPLHIQINHRYALCFLKLPRVQRLNKQVPCKPLTVQVGGG